eukprot:Clim_evm3s248 gene=Clim_evmTU3s248
MGHGPKKNKLATDRDTRVPTPSRSFSRTPSRTPARSSRSLSDDGRRSSVNSSGHRRTSPLTSSPSPGGQRLVAGLSRSRSPEHSRGTRSRSAGGERSSARSGLGSMSQAASESQPPSIAALGQHRVDVEAKSVMSSDESSIANGQTGNEPNSMKGTSGRHGQVESLHSLSLERVDGHGATGASQRFSLETHADDGDKHGAGPRSGDGHGDKVVVGKTTIPIVDPMSILDTTKQSQNPISSGLSAVSAASTEAVVGADEEPFTSVRKRRRKASPTDDEDEKRAASRKDVLPMVGAKEFEYDEGTAISKIPERPKTLKLSAVDGSRHQTGIVGSESVVEVPGTAAVRTADGGHMAGPTEPELPLAESVVATGPTAAPAQRPKVENSGQPAWTCSAVNNQRQAGKKHLITPGSIDRSKVVPFLVRCYNSAKNGAFHSMAEFGKGRAPVDDELIFYTWMDATLKELVGLLKSVFENYARRGAEFRFRSVYVDRAGEAQYRDLGRLTNGVRGPFDSKTLGQCRFQIGDALDVAVFVPTSHDDTDSSR